MKKLSLLLIICSLGIAVSLVSFRISPQSLTSNGQLGDVKYSVLNPQQFLAVNGKGWALLQGQYLDGSGTELKLSPLFKRFHIKQLPDARGVFIRGMNLHRDIKTGDPDGERDLAHLQMDALKKHHHSMRTDNGNTSPGPGVFNTCGDNRKAINHKLTEDNVDGATETRPRNIALYVYVKVAE